MRRSAIRENVDHLLRFGCDVRRSRRKRRSGGDRRYRISRKQSGIAEHRAERHPAETHSATSQEVTARCEICH
jgi:hypothetical protein